MTTIQRRFAERASAVWSSARRQQQFGWQALHLGPESQVWAEVYLLATGQAVTIYETIPAHKTAALTQRRWQQEALLPKQHGEGA